MARSGKPRSLTRSGEAGFTLVEILVVIAILGVLAAVVVINVTGFAGAGALNSANTEAHQVQTAVIAYMEANSLRALDCVVGDGSEESSAVERYLLNPARLQARYSISDGRISDAFAYPDGKWADCYWDTGTGEWRMEE